MPSLTPYTLHFKGGLHLGTRGINLGEASEFIPSDTLFSALLDTWNRLGKDVAEFVTPYQNANPPFLLSSAFPFAGEVRFYPLPVDLRRIFSPQILDDVRWRKQLRKIRYFSEGLLRKALAGDELDPNLFLLNESVEPKTGVALQGGALWLLKEESNALPDFFLKTEKGKKRPLQALRYLHLWKNSEVPRVTIDRIDQNSTLYHAGRVSFAKDCGLWFGVEWIDKNDYYINALAETLHALQYDGLGGERSSGYGGFTLQEEAEISFNDAKIGETGYLLNRYHPDKKELPKALQSEKSAYKLVNVAGWLHTNGEADQRRRKLWMLEAGSLIHVLGNPQGSLEDLQPNYENEAGDLSHPVWRYGFALPLGGLAEVK